MTRWSPYRMPRIRRDLIAANASALPDTLSPATQARAHAAPTGLPNLAGLERDNLHLRGADLWWVTAEMTRIALDASADLPAWTPAAVRPSPFGLLVWDGGLPHLPWPGAPETAWTTNAFGARTPPTVAVDGVWWGLDPVGIRLHLLTRTDRISQWLTQRWAGPDLFAFGDIELSLHDPVPEGPSSDFGSGLVAALGTTWLLMAQPTVVSRIPMREPQTGRGAYRAPTKEPVTLVDLRRLALPPRDPDGEPSGRAYRHRWMVRGHWRQQACGAGRAQRRPTWVPPHVKGPQGAPLLETEHVMVWKR